VTTARALVVDWGGVLTVPLDGAMSAWALADGVDVEHFADVLRGWRSLAEGESGLGPAAAPVHALERGEMSPADFEQLLAGELLARGSRVSATGLLGRMLAGLEQPQPAMYGVVRRARTAGVRTALLSNSWGNTYDRSGWEEMFDAVVISGEVGMRKPEARIFRHTAQRLGVRTTECVLVDDLPWNVDGARAVGMDAVLHRGDVAATAAELETLLGVTLQ
jgi:putative hydrolase of the HAD superfamily